jgi:hypothetical protein
MGEERAISNQHSDGRKTKRGTNPASIANLTRGSRKGIPNKVTAEAKEVIAEAAQGLGGVERLIDWAKESPENETKFWATIYPRLIPVTVANAPGESFRVTQADEDASTFRSRISTLIATGAATGGTGSTQH